MAPRSAEAGQANRIVFEAFQGVPSAIPAGRLAFQFEGRLLLVRGYLMILTPAKKIVQVYQKKPISSRQFYFRLFEVVVLAIHSLGGSMYISSHPNANIRPREYDYTQHPHYPVDLYHKLYLGYFFYPYGLLDTVGHWTETQIFGGVVLLKHEQSGSEVRSHLHPC